MASHLHTLQQVYLPTLPGLGKASCFGRSPYIRRRGGEGWSSPPCAQWRDVRWATYLKPQPDSATLRSVPVLSTCSLNHCNFVNFTIFNLTQFLTRFGSQFAICIYGTGADPCGLFALKVHTLYSQAVPHTVVHSEFWAEINSADEPEAPSVWKMVTPGRNLFLELASSISQSLNVSNCFVCGGTLMGDEWPWEGAEWNVSTEFNISLGTAFTGLGRGQWILRNRFVGQWCLQRITPTGPRVGDTDCQTLTILNGTVSHWPNSSSIPPNLLWDNQPFNASLTNASYPGPWTAPPGLYWICGSAAYSQLPPSWSGTCLLGQIRPSFFLLPLSEGDYLEHPVYTSSRFKRHTRSAPPLKIGQWDDNAWIIRLQAVLELITNETSCALGLLAKQHSQVRTAIYQNRLALDYLLLAEGGVCGKFNLSDCCLQIDDHGEVIAEIVDNVRRLSHVPVQTWQGWNVDNPFSSWLSGLGSLKGMFGVLVILLLGCMLLPCLVPLAARSIRLAIESTTERKVASQILALQAWNWQSNPPRRGRSRLHSWE
uniref:Envelope protein syncytin-Car1 n=1 Tax=Pelusios castaneus TaxID=367368 RepID=A0A8C8R523_9SAUR